MTNETSHETNATINIASNDTQNSTIHTTTTETTELKHAQGKLLYVQYMTSVVAHSALM
jgi:hypothetical protein